MIAIIGLLAAILFPVFARARENARRTSCLSNTKQLGVSALQYAQDYDEKLVPGMDSGYSSSDQGSNWWGPIMQPYIKSQQVFYCPSDTNPDTKPGRKITVHSISYGWNGLYLEIAPSAHDLGGVNLAAVKSAAETVMVGDNNDDAFNRVMIRSSGTYQPLPRHFDGGNFGFVDGHSKWYKIPSVISPSATMWDLQ